MKIIDVAVRRRGLYLIQRDSGEDTPVDRRTWDESPYRVGSELTEEQWQALLHLSQYNRARERALYLLGLRDYACKELEQKLYTEAEPATAAAVVERLREVGLLDDERYARRLAKSLTEQKQYPRRRVEQELRRRGIDPLTVQEALCSLDGEDFQLALALIEKKYYNKVNTAEGRQKVTAALARRGFSYTAIRRALDEFGAAQDSEEIEEWL